MRDWASAESAPSRDPPTAQKPGCRAGCRAPGSESEIKSIGVMAAAAVTPSRGEGDSESRISRHRQSQAAAACRWTRTRPELGSRAVAFAGGHDPELSHVLTRSESNSARRWVGAPGRVRGLRAGPLGSGWQRVSGSESSFSSHGPNLN